MNYENQLSVVVVVGKMNPAILSHDFLERNGILPADLRDVRPEPTITPVVALLDYKDRLNVVVEPNRFIVQTPAPEGLSFLPNLVTKYFNTLPFTPLEAVGINFNGRLVLETEQETATLCRRLRPGGQAAALGPQGMEVDWRVAVRFPLDDLKATVSSDWVVPGGREISVSANYHRDLKESKESVHEHLDQTLRQMPRLLEHFRQVWVEWLSQKGTQNP
jgi:hypothetical protein